MSKKPATTRNQRPPLRGKDDYGIRLLPSFKFELQRLTKKFRRLFNGEVMPLLALKGYKLDQKQELAAHAVNMLIQTGLSGASVGDTRNKSVPGVELRTQVWDAIIAANLARVCLGSELSGKATRYKATEKLLTLRKTWRLRELMDVRLARNTELTDPSPLALVCLHTGKIDLATGEPLPTAQRKQPVSFHADIKENAQTNSDGKPCPEAIKNGLDYFRGIEDCIERINRTNLNHSWKAFNTDSESGRRYSFPPNPCLRQVHVGEFFNCARLYSWGILSGQNLSKQVRRTMLIDGAAVAELDFSGMAIRMLYHQEKIRVSHTKDIYRPDKVMRKFYRIANASDAKREIVRDFVKRVTNICWNVSTRAKAIRAATKLVHDHAEDKFLRSVIYSVEGIDVRRVIRRIERAHSELRDSFFSNVGRELMSLDGNIMLHALNDFVSEQKRPALAIHDSIVCKATDVIYARRAMRDAYRRFFPLDCQIPVIKQVF